MRKVLILVSLALLLFSAMVHAQAVPLDLQVTLILKIVSMDRNFDRFGNPIKIGVSSDAVLAQFKAQEGKMKVKANDFVVEKMSSLDDIAKYKVVYVDSNWSSNYGPVTEKANGNQTLVFCAEEEYVATGGASVSFKVVGGKPKIVINIQNAKNQGSDFPANFLQITYVVGGVN